ncbi:MAG: GGDEF domain-containing protein [Geminicoccaceae bacterium]
MAEPQPDGVIPPPPHRRADFRRRAQELLLLEVAIADPVLGCHNRAYLVHRARDEIARRQRYGQRLSLLLVEADRPIRGPEEGALKGIASIARLTVRPTDIVARWHAGEFVLLLPCTALAGATRLARRLCAAVAAAQLPAAGGDLTASIGVATSLGRRELLELLVQRARSGLAEARAAGGGRVGIG